jgi:DNA-directed RNA polymerase subunit RPC12/RpoP
MWTNRTRRVTLRSCLWKLPIRGMDSSSHLFSPEPVAVKCPNCWHQFTCSHRWIKASPLVECPRCSVMIHVKTAKPDQAPALGLLPRTPPGALKRRDSSPPNP